ncbi:MAG: helix-turn-helix transcriptional regulator [Aquabacterium sp.]|nr:helix-turn-helix transcriptional regulator [Aquabacterium sp.]
MSKQISDWSSYTARLLWAMNRAGKTNQSELARAVGVKPQSIQYLCDPHSGARGSSHTPSLARELGVSAEWLSTGQGQPMGVTVLESRESASPGYAAPATPVRHGALLRVTGTVRVGAQPGEVIRTDLTKGQADGGLILPLMWPAQPAILRVQGVPLGPGIKDGQCLVLQAVPDPVQLEPEDTVLITLKDGRVLLRELMVVREHSLLLLPLTGGQPEPVAREDVAGIELLVCVVPRRWWRAGV